jgi:heptosyltransferase III
LGIRGAIIRPGALGDTLMLAPSLMGLHHRLPLTVVGRRPGLEFIRPFADLALDMEGGGWHKLFVAESTERVELLPEGTDLVAAFFKDDRGWIKHRLEQFFPGIPVYVFPSVPPPGRAVHVARYVAECLASAGFPLDPDQAMRGAIAAPLFAPREKRTGSPYLVFHPGSGSPKKNHPPEFWLDLLVELRRAFSETLNPILLLGPAEEHVLPLFRERTEGLPILFCPPRDTLLSLLGSASLYVGHDSGVTHLAAMCGTPTIALFRSSDVGLWHPIGPRVKVMDVPSPDAGLIDEISSRVRLLLGGGGSVDG